MRNILLLVMVLLSINVSSQDFKKVNYQINAGTSLSIPDASPVFEEFEDAERNYSAAFGYYVNFLVSYNFTDKASFSSGLIYNSLNTKIDDELGIASYNTNWYLHYLNIPLMFDYNLAKHFTLSGGAYGGFLISAREKGKVYFDAEDVFFPDGKEDSAIPEFYETSIDESNKEIFKNYDFGLSAKVAYSIQLSAKYQGIISTQLNYGLMNAFSTTETVRTDWRWRNINLMIGFGIQF